MIKKQHRIAVLSCGLLISIVIACSSNKIFRNAPEDVRIVAVDKGWANNSINTVVFRKNSLVSLRDTQFIAFYDPEGFVVLGKRRIGEGQWRLQKTNYKGNVADAH